MAQATRTIRIGAPFMHAFRAAHAERDAVERKEVFDKGERVIAGRRAAARALVSERVLRSEVRQDVEQLLNTVNLDSVQSLEDMPEVRTSILNFGIPDIVHRTIDEDSVDEIVDEIRSAICVFEPRLIAKSVMVRRDSSISKDELRIRFVVFGELVMSPENIPVEFLADLDFETGKLAVNRL